LGLVCLDWLKVNNLKPKSLQTCLQKIRGLFTQMKKDKVAAAYVAMKTMGTDKTLNITTMDNKLREALSKDYAEGYAHLISEAKSIAADDASCMETLKKVFVTTTSQDGSEVGILQF
jgi:hypothetical protein